MAKSLFEVQFAHNTAYHESIKDVPYRIVFKDTSKTAIHAAADLVISESENSLESPAEYADNAQSMAKEAYSNVSANTQRTADARKQQYMTRVG